MNYLDKCVSKTDLLFRKLKPSSNLIVFILYKNLYFAYTLSDLKKIVCKSDKHYMEGKENLETFFYLPNGIKLDSSFQDCYNRKINTLLLVKNENKFRIGFGDNKQIYSFYTVKQASRKDIGSNEIDTFSESETNNETGSDSENDNEIDWAEIKKQQEKRLVLENKQKTKVNKQTGNYIETEESGNNAKKISKFANNKLVEVSWFQNHKRHREDDLPAVIHYYENGNKKAEGWYKDNKKYRENNLPELIEYYENENGIKQKETWYQDNPHPFETTSSLKTVIQYYKNGNKEKEEWYTFFDHRHRDGDLPVVINYYENGNKETETWGHAGNIHRENDLPAGINYYDNGEKKEETWYQNNKKQRNGDLPGGIDYHQNGNKKAEWWYRNNEIHREGDLPSLIFYDKNGIKRAECWYKNGKNVKNLGYNWQTSCCD